MNPLRLVYTALWTMLEAHAPLMALVLPGNRIKYTGTVLAVGKDTLANADTPELRLVATGFAPHLQQTSSGSSMIIYWAVQITSGDQRFETVLNVQWEVWRALRDWEDTLPALEFESKRFVTHSRPLAGRMSLDNKALNRGVRGWTTVWACETRLDWTTSDL